MKNIYLPRITISSLMSLTLSCGALPKLETSRKAASINESANDLLVKKFETIQKLTSDKERLDFFIVYLKQQESFFYISQNALNDFDTKLDVIYNHKISGKEITIEEVSAFTETKFKNQIAWEFSESNLHELSALYQLAVKSANTPNSEFQNQSLIIINAIDQWVKNEWASKEKKQIAYDIALQLNEAHENLESETNPLKVSPDFRYILNAPLKVIIESAKSLKRRSKRTKTAFDTFVETNWNAYLNQRTQESEKQFFLTSSSFGAKKYEIRLHVDQVENSESPRTPQSSYQDIVPSAKKKGNITGNTFPPGSWAITFDDGPSPKYTQKVVDNLKKYNVHGTFFWQAQNVIRFAEISKINSNLYSRALHSYTHANLPKQSIAGLKKEIHQASEDFAKVIGQKPTLFRCPYGACGPNDGKIRKMIADENMVHVLWNVDTLDWQDKNPDSIFKRAKKQIDSLGRGIVLFHDIHPQSVVASEMVIKYLKSKYKLEPLNKLIEELRGNAYPSP